MPPFVVVRFFRSIKHFQHRARRQRAAARPAESGFRPVVDIRASRDDRVAADSQGLGNIAFLTIRNCLRRFRWQLASESCEVVSAIEAAGGGFGDPALKLRVRRHAIPIVAVSFDRSLDNVHDSSDFDSAEAFAADTGISAQVAVRPAAADGAVARLQLRFQLAFRRGRADDCGGQAGRRPAIAATPHIQVCSFQVVKSVAAI